MIVRENFLKDQKHKCGIKRLLITSISSARVWANAKYEPTSYLLHTAFEAGPFSLSRGKRLMLASVIAKGCTFLDNCHCFAVIISGKTETAQV